jgi:hypothetical protein
MKLVLLEGFSIRNADANFTIGEVRPTNGAGGPFRVFACVLPDDEVVAIEVAVVNSLDECLPALADYYEQNPPRWVRKGLGWYEKETLYSNLRVEQNQRGQWRAYRDGFPLLEWRGAATFLTGAEAQRIADVHLLDSYPNAEVIDDEFSWVLDPELEDLSLGLVPLRSYETAASHPRP